MTISYKAGQELNWHSGKWAAPIDQVTVVRVLESGSATLSNGWSVEPDGVVIGGRGEGAYVSEVAA